MTKKPAKFAGFFIGIWFSGRLLTHTDHSAGFALEHVVLVAFGKFTQTFPITVVHVDITHDIEGFLCFERKLSTICTHDTHLAVITDRVYVHFGITQLKRGFAIVILLCVG